MGRESVSVKENRQGSEDQPMYDFSLAETVFDVQDFNVWINESQILQRANVKIPANKITCILGPSGAGKSTLIRCLNRINDEVVGLRTTGTINLNKVSITTNSCDVAQLRSKVGMVFQKPCVFPKSIQENVLFGIRDIKKLSKKEKSDLVREKLEAAFLWDEVSDRLDSKASSLSVGQQQRLCIARTLAINPEVILLDEPTSSLDPFASRAIENMMLNLKDKYTIIFVTHDIRQAKRIADNLIFICDGEIIEQGSAETMFSKPRKEKTQNYLNDEICVC